MNRHRMNGHRMNGHRMNGLAALLFLPIVVLWTLAAVPRSAAAHDTVRLSLGIANQWSWTDSVDALRRPNRFVASDLRFGVGVWQGLSVEAGYRYLTGDGDTFAAEIDTETVFHVIDIAARYDWPLLDWLSLYGRVGGSVARGAVDVTWFTAHVAANGWTPGAFAGGGVSARFPRVWFGGTDGPDGGSGFTMGLTLDVGYAWLADLALRGRPTPTDGLDGDADEARVLQSAIDLGTLRIHGLTVQIGVSLHY